jgi:hypothetical protein
MLAAPTIRMKHLTVPWITLPSIGGGFSVVVACSALRASAVPGGKDV